MNDEQAILVDTANRVFETLGPKATVAGQWPDIEATGLTSLLVPEAETGFGGGWEEALLVFRLAGAHAVALPIIESVLAARHAPPNANGFGSIAVLAEGEGTDRFTGRLVSVPWGRDAAWIVSSVGDRLIVLDRADARSVETGENTAGEPRDTLVFSGAAFSIAQAGPNSLLAEAALARVAQIAGALDAALGLSVAYANDRNQFGRPLGKFQSVQQSLAIFAAEAAAANCAAMGACQAAARGEATYEVAAAKLRANMAVGVGASIAHQVHGAIGFTAEYGLHPLTRRLWSWRSEYGGDAYWAGRLGNLVTASGDFWAEMVARSDPEAA